MSDRGVVITGMGAAHPLGLDGPSLWESLAAGRCGIGRIEAFDPTGFPCDLAGEVPAYRIRDYLPKAQRKSAKLMSRDIELAVIAAHQAVAHSGHVSPATDPDHVTLNPTRTGIILGAGLISCDLEELAPSVASSVTGGRFDLQRYGREGLPQVTPLWLLKYLPNMLACHVSILHDIQGPSNTITCAEASSLLAVAEATQIIQRGDCDVVLAGGAEAKVNPIVLLRQCLTGRAVTGVSPEPSRACRPFAADACGSVFGEAAGIFVLESRQQAAARAAHCYAEIIGVGQSCGPSPDYVHLEPDGQAVTLAVQRALAEAGIGPEQLDLIVPHGTAIPQDDRAEARGLMRALGPAGRDVPVWPIKSQVGNTGAAAGALDLMAAAWALHHGRIPAAAGDAEAFDGCDLNLVRQAQSRPIRHALCCSYTYGGQTAAVVLRHPEVG